MAIQLRPELEKRIRDKMTAGEFGSADDVVQKALDALDLDEDAVEQERLALRDDLDRRYEEVATGEVKPVPGDEALTQVRSRLKRIRAQR